MLIHVNIYKKGEDMKNIYDDISEIDLKQKVEKQLKLKNILVNSLEIDKDFYVTSSDPIGGLPGRDVTVLKKGGAERIAGILDIVVEMGDLNFEQVSNSNGNVVSHMFHVKAYGSFNGKKLAEGVAARLTSADSGEVNTTAKMVFKSAYIDVVIRAAGLAGHFTQDINEAENNAPSTEDNSNKKVLVDNLADILGDRSTLVAMQNGTNHLQDMTTSQALSIYEQNEIPLPTQNSEQVIKTEIAASMDEICVDMAADQSVSQRIILS